MDTTGILTTKTAHVNSPGYYYFNGTLWEKIITDIPVGSNIYNSDGIIQTNRNVAMNDRTIAFTVTSPKVNQFSVDDSTFSIDTQNDRIGIGTTTPTTKVDINGNLRIGAATSSNGSTNVSTLVRDNITGEVKIAASSTGNVSPINYIVYTISNVQGDWISNYDTKVSSTEYTMTIVGSSFSDNLNVSNPTTSSASFSPFSVFAYKSGTTWRLKADYSSASTLTGNGTWTLYCLIINNSILKTLAPVSQDLGGSQTGSAASAPAGL